MAAGGSTAKLHHYVPQSYLRGFATDKDRVTVVPLDRSRKPYTPSIRNVAAQTRFHRVDGLPNPDEFEQVLSGVEGDAMSVVRQFGAEKFPPSEEERWKLSFYIALQAVRGPDTRRTMEHLQAKVVRVEVGAGGQKNVKQWIEKNLGFAATDEQAERLWAEATQPGGPPITFSNLAHIDHMTKTAEAITSAIAARPWLLVRFGRRSLITSDAPVTLIRNPKDEPWEGVGFQTAWGITFPLTRKLGLLMSDPMVAIERFEAGDPRIQAMRAAILRGEADRSEPGTTAMERLFNQHTAHHAREYVYHHPDDARFVPDDLPEPHLITMDVGGFFDAEFDGKPWFTQTDRRRRAPRLTRSVETR